ncbi:SCN4A_2 [Blepharisma stoltei]|uniref:Ion transport domain-containing protein n=1 Tax=Blepharisma stoltei TaxID=1481888 RepID=A0AAU9IQS0_9CILI|nr:unnamed protein product [Blepharisma stoltei]
MRNNPESKYYEVQENTLNAFHKCRTDDLTNQFFRRNPRSRANSSISNLDIIDIENASRNDSRRSSGNFLQVIHDSSQQASFSEVSREDFHKQITALEQSFHKQFHKEFTQNLFTSMETLRTLKSLAMNPDNMNFDDQALLKGYIKIREQNPFEYIENIRDKFPLILLRKALLRIKASIAQLCNIIVSNPIFEVLIVLVILSNAVVLAVENPISNNNSSILTTMDTLFLYIYTSECAMKLIGKGVIFTKEAYFKDPWNILDFVIVATAWASYYANQGVNLSALRSLRILRPLKTISSIQGLRVLFLAFFGSLLPLLNILAILFFFLLIFAIGGVQLFMGLFKYSCINSETGQYLYPKSTEQVCGALTCPLGYYCVNSLNNPLYGMMNFDNVIFSWLQCFTAITEESWAHMMIIGEKSLSQPISIIFFVSLVSLGSFLMLSLIEVILYSNFSREMEKVRVKQSAKEIIEEESADSSVIENLGIGQDSPLIIDEENGFPEHIVNDPGDSLFYKNPGNNEENKNIVKNEGYQGLADDEHKNETFGPSVHDPMSKSLKINLNLVEDLSNEEISQEIDEPNENELVPLSRHQSIDASPRSSHEYEERNVKGLIQLRLIPTRRESINFLRQNSSIEDYESSVSLSKLPLLNQSVENTVLVTDSKDKTIVNDNKTDYDKRRSITTKISSLATNNIREQRRTSVDSTVFPMINRVKNIKIRKDLLRRMKHGEHRAKVKISVDEHYEVEMTSLNDVIPKEPKKSTHQNPFAVYRFSYRGGKNVLADLEKLTQRWDNKICDILDKYKNKGDKTEIFRFLCKKYKIKESFYMVSLHVEKIVKKIREYDRITQDVKGDWSGYDVYKEGPIKSQEYKDELDKMNYIIWSSGIWGKMQKIKYPLFVLMKSKLFNFIMVLCVVANTAVLSSNYYGIDEGTDAILTKFNTAFAYVFVADMFLKVIGLGIKEYCRDKMNYFDAIVSIFGLLEIIFSSSGSTISVLRAIKVLRNLRVIRVVRMFRYLQSMSHIINKLSKNIGNLFYLLLFVMLFLLIFTIIGIQIFSGKLNFKENYYKYNFDNFHFSFLSIFQIMTEENWNIIEVAVMRSQQGYISVIFPCIWLVLGNYILLNLFLALVLEMFANEEPDDYLSTVHLSPANSKSKSFLSSISSRTKKRKEQKMKMIEALNLSESGEWSKTLEDLRRASVRRKERTFYVGIECEKSFYLFTKTNRFRLFCHRLSSSQSFENFILVMISLSTISLIWDTYLIDLPENDPKVEVSGFFDIIFITVFGLEMIIKQVSMGVLFDKGSYLRNSWCQLDLCILLLSITDQCLSTVNISFIRVLRLLRTLRPLRIISHNVSMKIMINALVESLVSVFNVAIVMLVCWLIFAILGVSLFAGTLYSCENPNIENQVDCEKNGYNWTVFDFNFDNVLEAMVSLFVLTSQESWTDYMYAGCSAYEPGHAPIVNYNPGAAYYFVVHMFISSIFFINLLSGVIFEKFNDAKRNESSLAALILTKDQMLWVEIQSLIAQSKPQLDTPQKPKNKFQIFFYVISTHWIFESFILVCIILNFIQMSLYYDEASDTYNYVLEIFNFIFTSIFIVEAVIKISGSGINYFKDRWNRFDFLVACVSIADLIMEYIVNNGNKYMKIAPQLVRALRVIRVTRVIRLIKRFQSLQDLITLLSYSIPSIMNVTAILLLIYIIYAILGVYLFHSIDSGQNFDSYNNMHNFDKALVKLFRHSTGEDWPLAMFDCAHSSGKIVSYLYWISFISLTTFILLNVFVMVIIQNYNDFKTDAKSVVAIFNNDVKIFKKIWSLLTVTDLGLRMHYKFLVEFMYRLGEELGVPMYYPHEKVIKLLSIMDLDIDADGYVYYNDMLFAVMKRKHTRELIKNLDERSRKLIRKEENSTWKKLSQIKEKSMSHFYSEAHKNKLKKMKKTNLFFAMIYAKSVFKSWKNYTMKKRNKISGSVSITPLFSEVVYPGENSISSINDLSSEDNQIGNIGE